ncbi:N-acetylmuramoyl-L-alanine amidase [Mammaliicoccus sciuri]|uniref:N-acetylmuramoyl-L-alanine amidase n=1 Tax=Mammaliicoccus sciuri TaxID=1296 RepID=UPI00265C7110|nr:N-acetylmuramoyl-L-alanine amidase [Mammaliicoccus sciuri]MDO0948242.1 N-acetylmuramoyl-L-alanine amidase [Mammaliicoccus sciuri]MDO0953388.1 N-acetylmuramoyl-L-alanine amidase [Mammaliicoccus sciuri]
MTVTKTQAEAYSYMNKLVGKGWDFDGSFGWQCFDLVNFYWNYLTGGQLYGLYAKDIPFKNNFDGLATVYENTPSFLPQKGDIVVWNGNWGEGCGHVAIVHSANINTFVSLDQNWWGGGRNKTEVAQYITHTYDFPMYFIRPHFKVKSTVKSKVTSVAKPKATVTKKKFVLVAGHGYNDPGAVGNGTNERDFIRKNIIDNVAKYLRSAGHTVTLYDKKQDMYQDTAYGYNRGDTKNYGLYWVKNKLKPDAVIEFHLDAAGASASGGHVIKNAYTADNIDKGIQKALEDTVGTIRGITTRNDLLNVNVAYNQNINYRLVELGFITSKKDMDYIKKNLQAFTKRIAEGIHGKPIGGTPGGKSKKNTWDWKGRFTASTAIKVRKSASLVDDKNVVNKGSWIKKGDWFDFVQLIKVTKGKKKYWMAKFKYPTNPKAGYFYTTLGEITDKTEKIKSEKKLYGKIKWK